MCKALSVVLLEIPGLVRGAQGPVLMVHYVVMASWTQLTLSAWRIQRGCDAWRRSKKASQRS